MSHASIDRRHHAPRAPLRGVIRRQDVTDTAGHDGRMLRRGLLDRSNTGSTVRAYSAYRSKANADASRPSLRHVMEKHGFRSQVHRRKPRDRPMALNIRQGNAALSAVWAGIKHVFAHQKWPMDLSIRTNGIARAKAKIALANLTYSIRQLVFLGRRHGLA